MEGKYGDVLYADTKNKKYPIDNAKHIHAAAAYFARERNRSKYSPEEQEVIWANIHAARNRMMAKAAAECLINLSSD